MRRRKIFTLLVAVMILVPVACNQNHPKITVEDIQRQIIGKSVLTGEGPDEWIFDVNVPRKISIVESEYVGDQATLVVDMETIGGTGSLVQRKMAGKVRLDYKWVDDQWNLTRIESLTFKEQP